MSLPTPNAAAPCSLTARRALGWTLAWIVPCYVLIQFGHDLWRPCEAREAGIAREMIESGNWTATHAQGRLFLEKPPLYTWLLAGSLMRFGYHEWALRLPALALTIGTLLVTFSLAQRRLGPRGALVAALLLATMWLFLEVHRGAMTDNGLLFFMTLAMAAFERLTAGGRRAALWAGLFYTALAGTFLCKGGVGVALIAVSLAGFLAWERPARDRRRWHPLLGLAVIGLLDGGWLLALWLRGGHEYYEVFFVRHHLVRFLGLTPFNPEAYPTAPWHYYLLFLAIGPLPWTLLIPPGLWRARADWREGGAEPRRTWRFLICWILGMLCLLSLAGSKASYYLLPVFPALAILAAAGLDPVLAGRPAPRWATRLAILSAALPAAGLWAVPLAPALFRLQAWSWSAIGFSAALAALGAAVLAALGRGAHRSAWRRLAVLLWVAVAAFTFQLKPVLNAIKSPKPLSVQLAEILPNDAVLYTYDLNENTVGALIFYGQHPARLATLRHTLELGADPRPVYMLMEARDGTWPSCDRVLKTGRWRLVGEMTVGDRPYRLLGNRAATGTPEGPPAPPPAGSARQSDGSANRS